MFRSFGPNEVLYIVSAVQWTLLLSAIAFAGGAVGGIAIALARVSTTKPLRYAALARSETVPALRATRVDPLVALRGE